MASTTNPHTTNRPYPVAGPTGHDSYTTLAGGFRCACGHHARNAAALASHVTLAPLGHRVGPTGALLSPVPAPVAASAPDGEIGAIRAQLAQVTAERDAAVQRASRETARREAAEAKLAQVRAGLTRTELRLQSAAFANETLQAVAEAGFAWRTTSGVAHKIAGGALVEALDAHFIGATMIDITPKTDTTADEYAPATPEQAREYAAPFSAPWTPEELLADIDDSEPEDYATQIGERSGMATGGAS